MASYLAPVPPDLQLDIDRASRIGNGLLAAGRNAEAFELFRQLLERMLDRQPSGKRFHKGLPLHQMGLARIRAGVEREGLRFTLLAFIEDALSRAEESEVVSIELNRPAAQNLRLWQMRESELLDLAQHVRQRVARDGLFPDPTAVFVAEHLDATVERLTERAPIEVRVTLPFVQMKTVLTLPPLPAGTLITLALFALAAGSAFSVFWINGVLAAYWRVAISLFLVGIAVSAVVALVIAWGRGTPVGRGLLAALRWGAANFLVPLLVAVAAGLVVAYFTGTGRP